MKCERERRRRKSPPEAQEEAQEIPRSGKEGAKHRPIRHVNATKSYLYFCCFAGEAILCFKPYFQIVGSSKEKKS